MTRIRIQRLAGTALAAAALTVGVTTLIAPSASAAPKTEAELTSECNKWGGLLGVTHDLEGNILGSTCCYKVKITNSRSETHCRKYDANGAYTGTYIARDTVPAGPPDNGDLTPSNRAVLTPSKRT